MRALPTGTVTFLFTDVEGSTRLIDELGEGGYARALAEHRRVVRETCTRHGGVEVDTQGDAFFVAFASARDGVDAAREAQEALTIPVRMGIHTGTPRVADGGYVGVEVHRAARIAAAGHGGQVVVSQATRALVDGDLTELGEHRLKDFAEPVALFQLGDDPFPPLRTISNTNLPRPASSFLGREAEVRDVLSLLGDGARLVTLTGPGGTGKTRLALEAASLLVPEYNAGVFWVGLAPLRDATLVTEQMARTLGAKESLAEHIGDREMLLLLDNLEQVIDCAPQLSALVERCPNLTLLVTSRELLRVSGEVEYPVPPLTEREAVRLFCSRSRLEPTDETGTLCARLDCLPLAVELAAARAKALTPGQILERLSGRLDLLRGGRDADPRQRTLRATIEWSYELLSPEEQLLLARLSVFAGGCTLDAAEDVCHANLDTLQSLVEKSLIRHTDGRFWLLETVREFAREQLAARDSAVDRHTEYFVRLAVAAREEGPSPGPEWLDRLEGEQDNYRIVFDQLVETGDATRLFDLLGFVLLVWWLRGERREGLRACEKALELSTEDVATEGCARTLKLAGLFATTMGDPETGVAYTVRSLALFRTLEHTEQIAAVLVNLGGMEAVLGRNDEAIEHFEEAVVYAERAGSRRVAAAARDNLGNQATQRGDYEAAIPFFEQAIAFARGDDAQLAMPLFNLAFACFQVERDSDSIRAASEGLEVAHRLGDMRALVDLFALLGARAARQNDDETAALLLGAAEGVRDRTGLGQIGEAAETALYEETRKVLRARLGGRYDTIVTTGCELSVDEAVRLAAASIGAGGPA